MSDKIDVKEFLKKEIRPPTDALQKTHKEQTEKLQEILFSLAAEVEKKNERMIRMQVKALEGVIAELANRLSRAARLLERIEGLEADESFMANRAEVEKVTGELSELERKMTKNYGIAKSQLDGAKDTLEADEAEEDASEITEEWAVTEAWMRKSLEIAKTRLDKLTAVQDAAKRALAARDTKGLADAAKESEDLVDAKPSLQEIVDEYETSCKKCDIKKLTKEQQDQIGRDRATFDKIAEEIGSINAKIIALDVVIEGMEIEPVDAKKAASVLKIPSSLEAKLRKALELEGTAQVKALDALAKDAKLDTSGKEMIAALKKAKLF